VGTESREQQLRSAAELKGLSLVRSGNTYALAEYKLANLSLDEIASYLGTDNDLEEERMRAERAADYAAYVATLKAGGKIK
jgi:hypothetical protein